MADTSKDIIRRFIDEIWNRGRLDALDDFVAPGWVDHNPLSFAGRAEGSGALGQVVSMVRAGIPDLERTIDDQVAEGDLVVTRFTDSGTNTGRFFGMPATGKPVQIGGVNIDRVVDGRIAETWHVEDLLGAMQQLGHAPG